MISSHLPRKALLRSFYRTPAGDGVANPRYYRHGAVQVAEVGRETNQHSRLWAQLEVEIWEHQLPTSVVLVEIDEQAVISILGLFSLLGIKINDVTVGMGFKMRALYVPEYLGSFQ